MGSGIVVGGPIKTCQSLYTVLNNRALSGPLTKQPLKHCGAKYL